MFLIFLRRITLEGTVFKNFVNYFKNMIFSIKNIKALSEKVVFVRVDYNVPIKNRKITEDTRLKESMPTIKYLLKEKAKVVLITHLGRPEGVVVSDLKVDPIAARLSQIINKPVKKIGIRNYKLDKKELNRLKSEIEKIKPGQMAMLENIRFSPFEEGNKGSFAKNLASLGDSYVLDGFAVSHRADASVVGLPNYLPSYAGLLLEKEISGLSRATKNPKNPFVLVMGGIKLETKIPVIKKLLPKVSELLIGGGIASTYFYALGYGVGDSLVDIEYSDEVERYCKKSKVIKPVDVVVGDKNGKKYRVVEIAGEPHKICSRDEAIYDIGPATIRLYSKYIKKAQTIVWNGAMGLFEKRPYRTGTYSVARLVASRSKGKAFGVIGGGETLEAMDKVHMAEYVDLVSTGGGAMLEFLSGKKLAGIEALRNSKLK